MIAKNINIENVAGSVWLGLFMNANYSTPHPPAELSRIQHKNHGDILDLETIRI
jgi:hypothetical protein